ncbi:chromosome segregation protein SMC [Microbacterium sp. SORGH_AS_0862]|uniref:chromosome segregation protein SMC n=1 Tax=Microbacterium sp. SORGH_AS_0862 TaxID=3041789 RepID=UPI00278FAD04|nr:chromosome segregation protein SMC [Microbacterium sp. SORGH_AS_0862]MDQ1206748.1 chromosome segregation protein [Microbacterium sp. SORGH_AS_0862]
MHLKSVTLKGFKSFAQPTTFALEPGVTAIVGPNGSGKSNVVDALAWVMGEQGAKTLRGGKMEDVIFAGTSTRGPLGRAEVQLTIDNADGALPIEYAEVTISRTLFRNGASEYAINGQSCRLLDVQELLSDSGLGREMHVIVGQGRLDTVLQASPEDRRGFIEEAAGILKHRRRKEKTLRKLEAMEANLTRLSDLAGELRRQLKPLGRQADIAREAATIAAVVRDARARLLADELVALQAELADFARNEQDRRAERTLLQDRADQVKARVTALETQERSEAVDAARRVAFGLEQVQERLRGLYTLAGQRLSLLSEDEDSLAPAPTVSQAAIDEAREELDTITTGVGEAEDAAAAAARDVTRARAELDALDADIAAQSALVSEHDMRLTALRGTAEAAESALAAVRAAVERQQKALDAALARRAEAEEELAGADPDLVPETSSAEHAAAYEQAQRHAADAETEMAGIRERLHATEREVDALSAQVKTLGRALDVRTGASELIAAGGSGVRGLVGDAVQVTSGYEAAIAAALGAVAEGVLVDSEADALDAAAIARSGDFGVVDIVIAEVSAVPTEFPDIDGAVRATDVMTAPAGVAGLLARVVIAADLPAAQSVLASAPDLTVVTRAGEIVTRFSVRAGSGQGRSRLELAAERDAAAERLGELQVVADSLREALSDQTRALQEARARTKLTLDALRSHDAALAAHAEKVNRATVRHESAVAECERLTQTLRQAQAAVAEAEDSARVAADRLASAQEAPRPILDASARDGMLAALDAARDGEMRARLDVETLRERIRAGEARIAQLERQRERERAAAEEAARRAVIRRRQRDIAASVAAQLPALLDSVDRSVSQARVELAAAESARTAVTAELSEARREEAALRERLSGLTESVHGLELRIHEKKLHVGSLRERVQSELGLDENILISEYGPDQPIPDDSVEPTEEGERPAIAFDRGQQRKRFQEAERKLAQLGRVNPLALEEFAALEQRHTFLTEQLADLTQTRKDLLTIIEELDERMRSIFLEAFEDTRVAFTEVFPLLFPGGTGSIALTDPDNPLTTGIDVSVRPVGKKVERLSLLSGGERSLAAVALLVAIFKARPSPFYILDEVEAALDDANLGRLLTVFEQLRASSQLIVITHQKRTMEIADALYGVSMRQDGVSAVVGQRVRERESA